MNFATYTRKSVYSDKSDSVDNQQRMCREHIEMKYPGQIDSFMVYTDEGISGATTDRPDLQRMLSDVKSGLIDCLVVYQLDRISRNVRDFSNIYADLEDHDVKFISLKESVDTSTPIGKAMMYVTMTFAQMERETIATRVADNMIGLVKKGLWPMAGVPTGYVRKRVDICGKKHSVLEIDPEGSEYIKSIYRDFLEISGSAYVLQNKYRKEGKTNLRGQALGQPSLHRILTSPYYCAATKEVYDYWESLGCQMDPGSPREKWDGSCGVMVYGRHCGQKSMHQRPKEEWLVCLGLHPYLIEGNDWLAVQDRFRQNTFEKTAKHEPVFLRGIVRCKNCGTTLSTTYERYKGNEKAYYFCRNRKNSAPWNCTLKYVPCETLDEKILELFRKVEADPSAIWELVKKEKPVKEAQTAAKSKIPVYEKKIAKLTEALSEAPDSPAAKYIIKQIEELDMELQAFKREENMRKAETQKEAAMEHSAEEKAEKIAAMIRSLSDLSQKERNEIAKELIKECTWDGENLSVKL